MELACRLVAVRQTVQRITASAPIRLKHMERKRISPVAQFCVRWAFNLAALWVAAWLVSGVSYNDQFLTLIVASLIFSAINAFVRPVITILAIPFIIVTLGIALFFINLLMLFLTSWIVPDFVIDGFWAGVWATIIVWLVNLALSAVFRPEED